MFRWREQPMQGPCWRSMSGMFEVLSRLRERREWYRMKGEERRAGQGREAAGNYVRQSLRN